MVRQVLGRCAGQHLEDAELPNTYATEILPKQNARYIYSTRNLHLSKFIIGDRLTYSVAAHSVVAGSYPVDTSEVKCSVRLAQVCSFVLKIF